MRIISLLLTVVLLGLTACAAPAVSVPSNAPTSVEARPAKDNLADRKLTSPLIPRIWLTHDISAVIAASTSITPPAAPLAESNSRFPAIHITDWLKRALKLIASDGVTSNRAARELMLISVALNDALLVAKESGEPIDQVALMAGAARPVLRYLHPQQSDAIDEEVNKALWKGLYLRNPVPQARLERSFQIGHAVGDHIVAWAREDGSDAFHEITLPASGGWNTPKLPLDPHWGSVKTIALPAGDTVILPPPPAWDSPEMAQQRDMFRSTQKLITDEHRSLAWYWHADVGTITPAGLWFEIAITTAVVERLDLMQTAALLSHLGVAMHDTAVACWHNKYLYGFIRPDQWMATVEPDWQPVVPTPPHPSYPSGHAAFSSAAANLLIVAFPQHQEVFVQRAAEATRSRIVGGVHWVIDGLEGMTLGRDVAYYVVTR